MSDALVEYQPLVEKFIELKTTEPTLKLSKFCKQHSVSVHNFSMYLTRHPEIGKTISESIRKNYGIKSAEVYEAMYQSAINGDPRAMKLWLEFMENWNAPSNQGVTQIQVVFAPNMIPATWDKEITLKPQKIEVQNAENEIPCLDFTSAQGEGK